MFTVPIAARLYGFTLHDYGAHRQQGVLIASGSGIAMGIMDAVALRYAVDIDAAHQSSTLAERTESFAVMCNAYTGLVTLAGWFSLTDFEPFARAHAALPETLLYVGGDAQLGDLRSYIAQLRCTLALHRKRGACAPLMISSYNYAAAITSRRA
jgi:hypothetical protein